MKKVFIGIAVFGVIMILVGIIFFKESNMMGIITRVGGLAALIGLAASIYISCKR